MGLFVHTLRTAKSATVIAAPPAEPDPKPDRCSPRLVANLVLKTPEGRGAWEQNLFRVFHTLAQRFLDLLLDLKNRGTPAGFATWMADASDSSEADVRRFANRLEQDRAAVEVAMALPWSNGRVEGAVNRLKTIDRQMYGRANFHLLRRRVLEPAYPDGRLSANMTQSPERVDKSRGSGRDIDALFHDHARRIREAPLF